MSEFTEADRERIAACRTFEPRVFASINRLLAERDRLVEELTYATQRRDEVEDALIVQVERCARLRSALTNYMSECPADPDTTESFYKVHMEARAALSEESRRG